MKKQLRISLAASAVAVTIVGAGVTSHAMAQERAAVSGYTGPISSGPPGATRMDEVKPNGVIRFLEAAIWCSQDSYLARTNDEKKKAQIIEASNRATFAILNLAQQRVQEKALMIDRFAPDKSLWKDIARTPSIVKTLLEVTPAQIEIANKADAAIWDKIVHPTDTVKSESRLLGLPQREKLNELANPVESNAVQQHRRWLDGQYEAASTQVRNSLTEAQKAEWDAAWNLYRRYLPKTMP